MTINCHNVSMSMCVAHNHAWDVHQQKREHVQKQTKSEPVYLISILAFSPTLLPLVTFISVFVSCSFLCEHPKMGTTYTSDLGI